MLTCVAGVSVMCVGVDVGVCVSMGEEKHLCERESMHARRARKATCSIFGPGRVQLAKSRKSCALNKVVKQGLFFLLLPVHPLLPNRLAENECTIHAEFSGRAPHLQVCAALESIRSCIQRTEGRPNDVCRPANRQYMAINAHLSRTTHSFLLHHVHAWHTHRDLW